MNSMCIDNKNHRALFQILNDLFHTKKKYQSCQVYHRQIYQIFFMIIFFSQKVIKIRDQLIKQKSEIKTPPTLNQKNNSDFDRFDPVPLANVPFFVCFTSLQYQMYYSLYASPLCSIWSALTSFSVIDLFF